MKIAKEYQKIVVIGGCAVVVALVLIVLGAQESLSASENAAEIERQKIKIDELLAQKPCPVEENLKMIKEDNMRLEGEIARARYTYGHPEQAALDLFCREMGGIEPLKFKKAWDELAKKGTTPAFDSFLNDYLKAEGKDNANLRDGAKKSVAKMLERLGFKKIEDTTIVTRVLEVAMGAPIVIEPSRCQLEIHNADKTLRDAMQENVSQPIKFLEGKTFYYTFDDYKDKLPSQDDVSSIMRQINTIEYILKLIKTSKISELLDIQRKSVINPERGVDKEPSKFIDKTTSTLAYTFEIKVKGTQEAIRQFSSHLYKAASNNYFFEISKLSITKSNLANEELALTNPKIEEKRPSVSAQGDEKKDLALEQNSVPLIGIDNLLDATFVINCYYYVPPASKTASKGGR